MVSGGIKAVKTRSGRRYGTVYLLYSRRARQHCVVTITSSCVGTATQVTATLQAQPRAIKDEVLRHHPTERPRKGRGRTCDLGQLRLIPPAGGRS
ncbi:hypothetical protein GCM10023334_066900 [Nonomuraea thailandensis]